jgi:hypothetical protein
MSDSTSSPAPFFHCRIDADGPIVRGRHECALGHRLPSPSDSIADGVFAGWRWDGASLAISSDRYAMYPLFYYQRGNEFAIAPSLLTLLEQGAPLDIDADALAVFLHLGFFVGDDTPFRHIKVVPPNAGCEWRGALVAREHRDVGTPLRIRRADAVEEYARLFRKAIAKRLPGDGRVAIPLSGGRDSRHIVLGLREAGVRPDYVVTAARYGAADNDVEIAALLARTLGLKHVVLEHQPRVAAELRVNAATSFCADEHAWFAPVGDYLRGTVGTIYDGIAGDVLSASLFQNRTWLDLYRAGRLGALADLLIGRSTDRLQRTIDADFRAGRATEIARRRIIDELARHAHAPNPLTMFFFWNRTRREIALVPFGIFSRVPICFCPYLDHQLFDFLASLPSEITMDKGFHTETIRHAYPRFADVPYASKRKAGVTLPATLALGSRVLWYGLRRRPSRLTSIVRLAAQASQSIINPAYRSRHRVINPVRLLYLFQLAEVRRRAMRSAAMLPLAVALAILPAIAGCVPGNARSVAQGPAGADGLWIGRAELATLPMSGPAWVALNAAAGKTCTPPQLSDQEDMANVCVLAKALVHARTRDQQLRIDVATALEAIVNAGAYSGRALALGRELAAYAISADLIDLKRHDPALDARFRKTITTLLTTPTIDGPRNLVECHELRPNNWGTHCGASPVAVAAYLGDAVQLARAARVFRGYLGDREVYAGFRFGDLAWQCDPAKPVGINPAECMKDGHSIDGVLPDDQRRGGGFLWPPPKENYVYEALQGALVQAVILHRHGHDAFAWQDRALLRAFRWLHDQAAYPAQGDDTWQPHLVNHVYRMQFPAVIPSRPGKNVGWTDWTHPAR